MFFGAIAQKPIQKMNGGTEGPAWALKKNKQTKQEHKI
jgi:hypothetical protein